MSQSSVQWPQTMIPGKCRSLTYRNKLCKNDIKAGCEFCPIHVARTPAVIEAEKARWIARQNVPKKATTGSRTSMKIPKKAASLPKPHVAEFLTLEIIVAELAACPAAATWWSIDLPADVSLRQFFLTMADVTILSSVAAPDTGVLVIAPPNYNKLEVLASKDGKLSSFSEQEGVAVTGTPANRWIVYRPGLETELKKIHEYFKEPTIPCSLKN